MIDGSPGFSALVNIAVAHMLEARPVIEALNLQPLVSRPLPVFANANGVHLIVSGNGKLAMSTAVGYLAALQQTAEARPAWLNIGLAGHGVAELGSGLLVNRIQDRESGQVYYPTPLVNGVDSTPLLSGDVVETDYAAPVAYDMEGSGFWQAAIRFTGIDFVQLFKIVSDNPQNHVDTFQVSQAHGLISARLDAITRLVEQLRAQVLEYAEIHALPAETQAILARWHFTRTQQSQLQSLLRRWRAHGLTHELPDLSSSTFADARALLKALESRVSGQEY